MEPFKNVFSPELVHCLADHLQRHLPGYNRQNFTASIVEKLGELEFKARAQLIADQLHRVLPSTPAIRDRILRAMLHPDEEDHANQPSMKMVFVDGACSLSPWLLANTVLKILMVRWIY